MKFSIRELILVLLLVAVCVLWWRDRMALKMRADELDRVVKLLDAEFRALELSIDLGYIEATPPAPISELVESREETFEATQGPQHLLYWDDPEFDLHKHLGCRRGHRHEIQSARLILVGRRSRLFRSLAA